MDIFKPNIDKKLIAEYFERNERKKQDEAWLKKTKPIIQKYMGGKPKELIDNYIISIVIPDASKFDNDKLIKFLKESAAPEIQSRCLAQAVNEEALAECVEEGLVDLAALKAFAWMESKGSPRLAITKRKDTSND